MYLLGEGQDPGFVTFSELKQRVATLAAALRSAGVKTGDRVVGKFVVYPTLF